MNQKIMFEPGSIVWHEEPSSLKSFVRQRYRWARGTLRLTKMMKPVYRNNRRRFLSDIMHGVYFYFSPFSLIVASILLVFVSFGLPLIFVTPLIVLWLVQLYLFIRSVVFFNESKTNILTFPVWFLLSNLHLVLLAKSYIDEKMNKKMSWDKVERTGIINYELQGNASFSA